MSERVNHSVRVRLCVCHSRVRVRVFLGTGIVRRRHVSSCTRPTHPYGRRSPHIPCPSPRPLGALSLGGFPRHCSPPAACQCTDRRCCRNRSSVEPGVRGPVWKISWQGWDHLGLAFFHVMARMRPLGRVSFHLRRWGSISLSIPPQPSRRGVEHDHISDRTSRTPVYTRLIGLAFGTSTIHARDPGPPWYESPRSTACAEFSNKHFPHEPLKQRMSMLESNCHRISPLRRKRPPKRPNSHVDPAPITAHLSCFQFQTGQDPGHDNLRHAPVLLQAEAYSTYFKAHWRIPATQRHRQYRNSADQPRRRERVVQGPTGNGLGRAAACKKLTRCAQTIFTLKARDYSITGRDGGPEMEVCTSRNS